MDNKDEEDENVFQLMRRMNKKGMFTQKHRTGESKDHIKDPKLKNIDLMDLYRKEKGEIPIVFETYIK